VCHYIFFSPTLYFYGFYDSSMQSRSPTEWAVRSWYDCMSGWCCLRDHSGSIPGCKSGPHPERPDRLAARLLAVDPDTKPRHFGDVMFTGKLLQPIDLLTFQPIVGNFFHIQEGSKPISREILFYLVHRSRKKTYFTFSRDEIGADPFLL
jgi:hypothetical protein